MPNQPQLRLATCEMSISFKRHNLLTDKVLVRVLVDIGVFRMQLDLGLKATKRVMFSFTINGRHMKVENAT